MSRAQINAPVGVWAPCDNALQYWMLFITHGASESEQGLLVDLLKWQALAAPASAVVRCWSQVEGERFHTFAKVLGVTSYPSLVFSHSATMTPGFRLDAGRLAKVVDGEWGAASFFGEVMTMSHDGKEVDEIVKHFRKVENWNVAKRIGERLAGELPGLIVKVGTGIGGVSVA